MNATTMPTGTALVDKLRIRYADSGADGPVVLLTSPWPESLLAPVTSRSGYPAAISPS
jgi:hypothetical protein